MRSNEQEGEDDDLAMDAQLCFALHRADSLVTRLYRDQLLPLGLTYPQYLVLLALWQKPGSSMGELRSTLGMDTGTLTPIVKRMEAEGLLRRRRDDKDERRVWVDMTEKATALREQITEARREVVRQLPLDASQMSELRGSLQRLSQGLSYRSGVR